MSPHLGGELQLVLDCVELSPHPVYVVTQLPVLRVTLLVQLRHTSHVTHRTNKAATFDYIVYHLLVVHSIIP